MRAFTVEPPGGFENAAWRDVELPPGAPEQALVAIHAVGLNPADAFQIEGRYPGGPRPPFISGRDASGTIVTGDAAGRWRPGDEVVVLQTSTTDLVRGTLCERQWIAADNLAPLPTGWTFADGAAAPLVYLTAYKALTGPRALRPGEVVVVTGASGGVGIAAVQLARALGATVVAFSRSAEKRERLRLLGADHVFSPDEPQLKAAVFSAVQRQGVDVVVDNVGGPSLTTAVHLVGVHGRVSVVGVLAGVEAAIPIPSLMFKRASLHGILVTEDTPAEAQAAWRQVVALLASHQAEPVIDHRYPAADIAAAFARVRGDVFGKVVVDIV